MKITDTISVNPSKKTMGHVEAQATSIFRSPVLNTEKTEPISLEKIIFPSVTAGTTEYKKYAVPLRTLFATILIATGITLLEASVSVGIAVCSLCFGAILALGLFTRPIMLGASVYYCILGALSLRAGAVDMTLFLLMFGCVFFAILGAGKYSCDQLLRRAVINFKKNRNLKRKEDFLGYKAFHRVRL